MSRSKKKPYISYCGRSNKIGKRCANRKFRRLEKEFMAHKPDNSPVHIRDVSDVWDFPKDGLAHYVGDSKFAKSEDANERELFRKMTKK